MSERCSLSARSRGGSGVCQVDLALQDRYQIVECLAITQLHRVYRALDRRDRRLVIIKVARAGQCQIDAHAAACWDLASEGAMLRRVRRYGLAGPRYLDHRHASGRPYLVSSLIPGYTLEALSQHGWMPKVQLLGVMAQVVQTVAALHSYGYVHHDLKPSNIVVRPDGRPVLIDWATACRIRQGRQPVVALTLDFASLEQIRGEVRVENDLYALGKTLTALFPAPDPALEMIVQRATDRRPDHYRSATQLARAIARLYLFHRMVAMLGVE